MKKNIARTIGIGFFLVIIGIYLELSYGEESIPEKQSNKKLIKVISVDKIVIAPNQYKNFLWVKGIVTKVDESNNVLLLGCEDACIAMPIIYEGKMPKVKSEIIVYGKIKKQKNGRYVFLGKEVKVK